MNKFDKFLQFLFQSKKGKAILAGGVIASSFLFGGCFITDDLACICESIGCDDCAACYSECDRGCYETCESCHGCDLFDYCFNPDGCDSNCGSCGLVHCGGCNSSCFTDCACDCQGGCGSCQFACGNYSCDQLLDPDNFVDVTLNITFPSGSGFDPFNYTIRGVNKTQLGGSLGINFEDASYLAYFTFDGFYYNNTLVVRGNGEIADAGVLTGADGYITLRANATERRAGERIRISFADSDHAGYVRPNDLAAVIGQNYLPFNDNDNKLDIEGFLGWRLQGSDADPVQITTDQVFHLYTFGADADATSIVLEPVFAS